MIQFKIPTNFLILRWRGANLPEGGLEPSHDSQSAAADPSTTVVFWNLN